MREIEKRARRKQFCVRFREEDELRDLYMLASEEGMTVAAYLRWLVVKEKERRQAGSGLRTETIRLGAL